MISCTPYRADRFWTHLRHEDTKAIARQRSDTSQPLTDLSRIQRCHREPHAPCLKLSALSSLPSARPCSRSRPSLSSSAMAMRLTPSLCKPCGCCCRCRFICWLPAFSLELAELLG